MKNYEVKLFYGNCELEDPTIKERIVKVECDNIKRIHDIIYKEYENDINDCDFKGYEIINLTEEEKRILAEEEKKKIEFNNLIEYKSQEIKKIENRYIQKHYKKDFIKLDFKKIFEIEDNISKIYNNIENKINKTEKEKLNKMNDYEKIDFKIKILEKIIFE